MPNASSVSMHVRREKKEDAVLDAAGHGGYDAGMTNIQNKAEAVWVTGDKETLRDEQIEKLLDLMVGPDASLERLESCARMLAPVLAPFYEVSPEQIERAVYMVRGARGWF